MPDLPASGRPRDLWQVSRYVVNGLVATAAHFLCLKFLVEGVGMGLVGLANIVAASFGIAVSFVGSRYFVFRSVSESWLRQATRFGALYGAIAVLHGLVLFLWTDVSRRDYVAGFAIATVLQVSLSYWGNKTMVFK